MKRPDYRLLQWTCAVFAALFVTSAVFAAFPQLDLAISGLFAGSDGKFDMARDAVFDVVRQTFKALILVTCIVTLAMLLFGLRIGFTTRIPRQIWLFVGSVFLFGPGLLVNTILKDNWGRARPANVQEFGGDAIFTPPFLLTDQCQDNCSFVSGEGSAIASLAIVLVVVFWHAFGRWRPVYVAAITVLAVIGISLRVVKGRHFTSDSIFAVLFSALVVIAAYRIFRIRDHRRNVTGAALREDLLSLWRYIVQVGQDGPALIDDVRPAWLYLQDKVARIRSRFSGA